MNAVRSAVLGDMRDLLTAGGMTFPDDLTDFAAGTLRKYNPMADPSGAERLGAALSDQLREWQANIIFVWEDAEDAVLGYIVGCHLGLSTVRTWDADGLVAYKGAIPDRPRALIVTDAIRDLTPIRAILAFAEHQGGEVLATGVLVHPDLAFDSPVEVVSVGIWTSRE